LPNDYYEKISGSWVLQGQLSGLGVQSVTGLNTDNTDPVNPIVQISVDGSTITGDGTPGNPLVSSSSPIVGVNEIAFGDPSSGVIISRPGLTDTGLSGQTDIFHDDLGGNNSAIKLNVSQKTEDYFDALSNSYTVARSAGADRNDMVDSIGNTYRLRRDATQERTDYVNSLADSSVIHNPSTFDASVTDGVTQSKVLVNLTSSLVSYTDGGGNAAQSILDNTKLEDTFTDGSTNSRMTLLDKDAFLVATAPGATEGTFRATIGSVDMSAQDLGTGLLSGFNALPTYSSFKSNDTSTNFEIILPRTIPAINDFIKVTSNPFPNVFQTSFVAPPSGTGTVTSVALSMPAAFSVAGSPILTSGTLAVTATGTISQYIRGDGSLATTPVGTVQSVGLTMPAAFSVAGTPVTGTGTLAVTGAGTSGQYIRGDGSLAAFPSVGGADPTILGDAFDGTVILNGVNTYATIMTLVGSTYTLLRHVYFLDFTINLGITLNTNGYQIFIKGVGTINGTVGSIGTNGVDGVSGAFAVRPGATALVGVGAVDKILLPFSGNGGNGSNNSTPAQGVTFNSFYCGGVGGSGGSGQAIGGSPAGFGAGGAVVVTGKFVPWSPFFGAYFGGVGDITRLVTGGSSGGGGNGANYGGAVQGAGGSGAVAPFGIAIYAKNLTISATGIVRSNGGNGGNGFLTTGINGTGGGGAGGAGGGRTMIYAQSSFTYTPNNQIQAKGGTGGLGGFGTGTYAGIRSQSGVNGTDGYVTIINVAAGTNLTYTGQF
jgi:hypothetical protein